MCTVAEEKEKQHNTEAMQDNTPHIGHLIKDVVVSKDLKISWLAKQLNCHRNNIYLIFSRSWIDTETLMRLCQVLQHDFFKDLSSYYNSDYAKKQ